MKAKSIHGASTQEIRKALENAMADGYTPTLAIVFISVSQDRMAINELLESKNIEVMGATSCGEFIDGYQSTGEQAILLMDIDPSSFSILFQPIGTSSIEDAATALGHSALEIFSNPSIIVCSTGINLQGELFEGEKLVKNLTKSLGSDKIFFGGMAGDDWKMKGSFVFTKGKETDYGIVALVLNGDKISLKGMAITGWQPLGIIRTVTKSKGNLLYEIDGKSAINMYLKYLGKEEKISENNFNIFEELGFEYPFIVERDSNETVLKSPMKIDSIEKALVMDLPMPEGSKFWFTNPPDFDIVEEVIEKAKQLKEDLAEQADALLIFSCAGREPILGPLAINENEGLAETWNVPMAGYYTYGEFGRVLNGKQNFHSGACCWVALKEKE